MEAHNSQDGHIVQVRDAQNMGRNFVGPSKICGEAPCGFADGGISTRDAQERYTSMKKLIVAMVLCVIFMSVEVVGGIKANSLAILTDAAHLLSDVAAFAISLFSLWAASWEATPQQSYGFFRIEILGALVSIQMIWLLAGILVYEAILRLIDDTGSVNGFLMFLIAAFGLVVNIIMALFLGHDHGHHGHGHGHGDGHSHGHGHGHGHEDNGHLDKGNGHGHHTHSQTTMTITSHDNPHHHHHHHAGDDHHHHGNEHTLPLLSGSSTHNETEEANEKKRRNINVQGAYLHVLGDSIQSVGVMIGGAVIWLKPEWKIIDLICTLIFSVIVLGTTIKMIRDILEVLMESTPREIDATKLQTGLLEMEEVIAIHELHIWAITVGKILLACHVKIRPEANADLVLDKVIDYIRREYNISHVTIQIERG